MARESNVRLVLLYPDSAELRWVDAVPRIGGRIIGGDDRLWEVEDVVQSGVATYTVRCVPARPDAPALLGELFDRVRSSVSARGRTRTTHGASTNEPVSSADPEPEPVSEPLHLRGEPVVLSEEPHVADTLVDEVPEAPPAVEHTGAGPRWALVSRDEVLQELIDRDMELPPEGHRFFDYELFLFEPETVGLLGADHLTGSERRRFTDASTA